MVKERVRHHDDVRRGEGETTPNCDKRFIPRNGNSDVQNREGHPSFEKHEPPRLFMPIKEKINQNGRSSKEIAPELLLGDIFLGYTAAEITEDRPVEFRKKFVNQNLERTRGTARGSVAPKSIRPSYVRKGYARSLKRLGCGAPLIFGQSMCL